MHFFKGQFQNAYVTHDFDAAKAMLDRKFGFEDWVLIDADMRLKTAEGIKEGTCKVGLAWQAGHQIELIQPLTGFVDYYLSFLPEDPGDPTPRFHHSCVRRDDPVAMRAEIEALGIPYSHEGTVENEDGETVMVFIYLDARETLGHYLEYIWATPETWDWLKWPKDRPVY